MGVDTEVVKIEVAHLVRDLDCIKKRVDDMERVIIDLRIGIAKIVLIGVLCTSIATPVLSAIVIKIFLKV